MATVLRFQPAEHVKGEPRRGDSPFVENARRLETSDPRAARVLGRLMSDILNGVPSQPEVA